MLNIKAIVEKKQNNDTANLSLYLPEIANILFALAYVYKNDEESDKWKRAEYESIYNDIYNESVRTYGKDELESYGIEDKINKVQTRY